MKNILRMAIWAAVILAAVSIWGWFQSRREIRIELPPERPAPVKLIPDRYYYDPEGCAKC